LNKADYGRIASFYDKGRSLSERNTALWLALVSRLSGASRGTADAGALSFPPGSFGIVFMSHLLHHVESPPAVLRECHRVLGPSGVVLLRYGAIEQIKRDVEHTLFPEVMEIDEARTPSADIDRAPADE
jgi:SAM-dependent methyltransferase